MVHMARGSMLEKSWSVLGSKGGWPWERSAIRVRRAACIVGTLMVITCGPLLAEDLIVESTFDTDLEGWVLPDQLDAVFSHAPSGGNPGGYAHFEDSPTMSNGGYILAPATYLGEWTVFDGEAVFAYDQNIFDPGAVASYVDATIVLIGNSGADRAVWTLDQSPTTTGQWFTFEAVLDSSLWTMTSGSWQALLTNVEEVYVLVERVSSASTVVETVGTDNIRLYIPALFEDGFESGNPDAWSTIVP